MDKNLDKMLSLLVDEIERVETTKSRFGKAMREIKHEIDLGKYPALVIDTLETRFTTRIVPTQLDGLRIAGIDGGLSRKRFNAMDLLLTRAIAVIFHFQSDGGPIVDFFPDAFPEPNAKLVMLSMSGQELDQLASLERIAEELKVAISAVDEFHVDIVLMDGSLIYHPRDRPPVGSATESKFQEVLALYRQLYNKMARKRAMLVGIVKDSRSTRVTKMLGDLLPHLLRKSDLYEKMQGIDYRWLVKISRDCDLLDTFLEEGERTFIFRYTNEIKQSVSTLPADLVPWASSIWVTYLKTARDDLPLRIEVMVKSEGVEGIGQLDRALSAILPLSYQHPEFGLPTPILEADARAKISNNETRLVIDRLLALSGLTYSTIEKRRARNPFGG